MTGAPGGAPRPSGFDAAVRAFTDALGDHLRPGVTDFADLFTDDGVIDVPFDGNGTVSPTVSKAAITRSARTVEQVLTFERVTVSAVHETADPFTLVLEYEALLQRRDLGGRFRRRYVSVVRLVEGRVASLREYGGPFQPAGRL